MATETAVPVSPPNDEPQDSDSKFSFITSLFHFKGTVFEEIWVQVLLAGAVAAGVCVYGYEDHYPHSEFFYGSAALGEAQQIPPTLVGVFV